MDYARRRADGLIAERQLRISRALRRPAVQRAENLLAEVESAEPLREALDELVRKLAETAEGLTRQAGSPRRLRPAALRRGGGRAPPAPGPTPRARRRFPTPAPSRPWPPPPPTPPIARAAGSRAAGGRRVATGGPARGLDAAPAEAAPKPTGPATERRDPGRRAPTAPTCSRSRWPPRAPPGPDRVPHARDARRRGPAPYPRRRLRPRRPAGRDRPLAPAPARASAPPRARPSAEPRLPRDPAR